MITFLKYLRLLVAVVLFVSIAVLTQHIVVRSNVQQFRKYDNSDIHHMKYDLFNMNIWKDKISSMVTAEIENFRLNNSHKEDLKEHVQNQLSVLIDKVDTQIKEANKGSTSGWLKQRFLEMFVDINTIKKGIPNYADTIVEEMTKEDTQKQLKGVVRKRVGGYLRETFSKQDTEEITAIMKRTGTQSMEETKALLEKIVPAENQELLRLTWILIGLSAGLFLICLVRRSPLPAPYFFLCLMTLLLLLFAGVTCPMIDMEAKISKFGFVLLGHPIEFTNQMVYFQSKSILDVFWILMADPNLQMKIVGVLMILFSIVFPAIKMSASIFYYYDVYGSRENSIVKFFVLKSGKWSLTDVQIVAILMAYIGFNGMVKTQFNIIRDYMPQVTFISTNGTTLQIGFFIFLTYALLAMFLSGVAARQTSRK